MNERDWLTADEVLPLIALKSRASLRRLRQKDPSFPPPIRPTGSRCIRWTRGAIDKWKSLKEHEAQDLLEMKS